MNYPKMEGEALKAAIAYHEAITDQSFGADKDESRELSETARKAVRLLNSGAFNCHTRQTAALVEILLGEPVSRLVREANGAPAFAHLQGAIITATGHAASTRPGISYAVAATNKDNSVRVVSADNTSFGALHPNHFRRASSEEIAAFVTERHGGEAQQPSLPDPRQPDATENPIPW